MRYNARNRLHLARKKYKLCMLLSKGPVNRGGDVQEIAEWLERLGLGQYAQRFAENEIDISVLPHLTDQDLKDIGIPLGHRRKILAAITELAGAARATSQPAGQTEPKTQDIAERRQLTGMFVALAGS